MKEPPRDQRYEIRHTQGERALWEAAAKIERMTLSDWMRRVLSFSAAQTRLNGPAQTPKR